jgi:hypothetical protein
LILDDLILQTSQKVIEHPESIIGHRISSVANYQQPAASDHKPGTRNE